MDQKEFSVGHDVPKELLDEFHESSKNIFTTYAKIGATLNQLALPREKPGAFLLLTGIENNKSMLLQKVMGGKMGAMVSIITQALKQDKDLRDSVLVGLGELCNGVGLENMGRILILASENNVIGEALGGDLNPENICDCPECQSRRAEIAGNTNIN